MAVSSGTNSSNGQYPTGAARAFLRLPAVKAVSGLSRSTLYARIDAGLYPTSVSLGPRAVGWVQDEIAQVNAARIAGRTESEIRSLVCRLHEARKSAAAPLAA